MKPWMGLALDALVIVCLTVLLALKAIPAEVGLSMLGLLVGAKATHRLGGGDGGAAGGTSGGSAGTPASPSAASSAAAASSVLALMVALGSLVMRQKVASVLALGALGLSTMTGCTRPLDTAIASANAAHDVGEAASIALDVGCTARYEAARAPDVPAIDRVCIPAGAAYSLYRTSHAALVAGIQAYEAGQLSPVELAVKAAQLASAAKGLSEAIARVR